MSSDPKSTQPPSTPRPVKQRDQGIRIFSYPKVIFIFPTLIVALICGTGMALIHGYTTAFWVAAAIFGAGAVICGTLFRRGRIPDA